MKGWMFFLFLFWQERDRDVWQKCWTVHQQLPRSSHRIQILAITVHCQIYGASQTYLPCNIFNVTSITCPYWNLPYISKKINNGISIWYNLDNLSLSLIFFFFFWEGSLSYLIEQNDIQVKKYVINAVHTICRLSWCIHLRFSMETCHVKVFYRLSI